MKGATQGDAPETNIERSRKRKRTECHVSLSHAYQRVVAALEVGL